MKKKSYIGMALTVPRSAHFLSILSLPSEKFISILFHHVLTLVRNMIIEFLFLKRFILCFSLMTPEMSSLALENTKIGPTSNSKQKPIPSIIACGSSNLHRHCRQHLSLMITDKGTDPHYVATHLRRGGGFPGAALSLPTVADEKVAGKNHFSQVTCISASPFDFGSKEHPR